MRRFRRLVPREFWLAMLTLLGVIVLDVLPALILGVVIACSCWSTGPAARRSRCWAPTRLFPAHSPTSAATTGSLRCPGC